MPRSRIALETWERTNRAFCGLRKKNGTLCGMVLGSRSSAAAGCLRDAH